jgi:hypothetical protein
MRERFVENLAAKFGKERNHEGPHAEIAGKLGDDSTVQVQDQEPDAVRLVEQPEERGLQTVPPCHAPRAPKAQKPIVAKEYVSPTEFREFLGELARIAKEKGIK